MKSRIKQKIQRLKNKTKLNKFNKQKSKISKNYLMRRKNINKFYRKINK